MPIMYHVQGQLERCKADYEERIKAIRKEAEDLQAQVTELQRARGEAQQHLQSVEKAVEDANSQAANREAELKVGLLHANVKCPIPCASCEMLALHSFISTDTSFTGSRSIAYPLQKRLDSMTYFEHSLDRACCAAGAAG